MFMNFFFNFCDCRYIATVNGKVNQRHLIAISEGTVIDGTHCTPDAVELLPQQPDLSRPRLRIVVLSRSLQETSLYWLFYTSTVLGSLYVTFVSGGYYTINGT